MIFDKGDVEAGFAPELDVRAGEEVEGCLLETALWEWYFSGVGGCAGFCSLLGTAKRRRPSRLVPGVSRVSYFEDGG